MARVRNRIEKPYLILCEGIDVENVMIGYLNSDALAFDRRFANDIQTLNFKGVEELPVYLSNLKKMEGYEIVRQILVLRDAERDVQKAINMVKKAFRVNGLPVPDSVHAWIKANDSSERKIATAFTLLPTCDANPTEGALEDLCLNILKAEYADDMQKDIQGFINEVKNKYGSVSAHEHKSRLHTYFSVNEDFISLKIGEAALAGAFDWGSEKLKGLKELMAAGFEQ